MANTVNKVIDIALAEVGYLEKKSNKQLDNKTANAGKNNYTKYGRDMHEVYPYAMDFPAAWCDAFVDWCFYKAYGISNAKALIGGNFDDYTPNSAQLYKKKGSWHSSPKVGDQIFFKNDVRIYHTGLVYKVDANYVYTVEGNTTTGSDVVANGGGVCKKKYKLNNSRIAGYGRPAYDVANEIKGESKPSNGYEPAQSYWKSYGKSYKVTASSLYLRRGAGKDKEAITILPNGMKVRCYGYYTTVGGTVWLLVVAGEFVGYCSKKYLK